MSRRLNILGEHAVVRTLGRVEQAKLFASSPLKKSRGGRAFQLAKDALKTRRRMGFIIERKQHNGKVSLPASYSAAMSLAHLLFPKNFPEPVATRLKQSGQAHSKTVYTKQVSITRESQEGINSFYRDIRHSYGMGLQGLTSILRFEDTNYYKYHKEYKVEIKAAEVKFDEMGLSVNHKEMNVGIRKLNGKKEFVFFEIDGINIEKLTDYVLKLPSQTPAQQLKKTQAMNLLKFIAVQEQKDGMVKTHMVEKN